MGVTLTTPGGSDSGINGIDGVDEGSIGLPTVEAAGSVNKSSKSQSRRTQQHVVAATAALAATSKQRGTVVRLDPGTATGIRPASCSGKTAAIGQSYSLPSVAFVGSSPSGRFVGSSPSGSMENRFRCPVSLSDVDRGNRHAASSRSFGPASSYTAADRISVLDASARVTPTDAIGCDTPSSRHTAQVNSVDADTCDV